MKTILNKAGVLLVALTGLTLASCDDFLNPDAESLYTTKTFYQSETDFTYAITAVYAAQQDIYDGQTGILHFLSARTDDTSTDTNTYSDQADAMADDASCGPTENIWKSMYEMITRCNSIIIRIDDVTFSDSNMKNYVKGEAYGLRAWAYDNLGKFFGGVPLIVDAEYTEAETRTIKRSTQAETFAQAVSDYKKAIELLPVTWSGSNVGRMSKHAANAALARLYMFTKDYANAKNCLDAVINSGLYGLADNYVECFSDAYDNNAKKDRVWEVQYIGGQLGEGQSYSEMDMPEDCGVAEGYAVRGSSAAMRVSADLQAAFEDGDLRKNAFTINGDELSGSNARGYVWCFKFTPHSYVPQSSNDWANNLPIVRYADVLLMQAEAINEVSNGPTTEAIGYVNQIRARARLANLTAEQTATKSAFLTAIKQERRIEFLWEGLRWFDLIRWGDWESTFKAFFAYSDAGNGRYIDNVKSYRSIFAIPQAEMDRYDNKSVMWQNDGY